ncbi:hypothetical protein T484DRAFT_1844239, partial [Baffinella frigidus]
MGKDGGKKESKAPHSSNAAPEMTDGGDKVSEVGGVGDVKKPDSGMVSDVGDVKKLEAGVNASLSNLNNLTTLLDLCEEGSDGGDGGGGKVATAAMLALCRC